MGGKETAAKSSLDSLKAVCEPRLATSELGAPSRCEASLNRRSLVQTLACAHQIWQTNSSYIISEKDGGLRGVDLSYRHTFPNDPLNFSIPRLARLLSLLLDTEDPDSPINSTRDNLLTTLGPLDTGQLGRVLLTLEQLLPSLVLEHS